MYLLRKPTDCTVRAFLTQQGSRNFTYSTVGATRDGLPQNGEALPGYRVDRTRVRLGAGPDAFNAACLALRSWRHFEIPWLELCGAEDPPAEGQVVAPLIRAAGLWVLNACRVVYVLQKQSPVRRFAFAYGTLPDHAESGEERFQVEYAGDDSVWYEILAFSRPHQRLAKLGHPYVRYKQRRFGRDSVTALRRALSLPLAN